MAFVPENGTGLANANSYSDVATADSYFADRGVAAWAALTTPQKQAALVQATDYIDLRFGQRFKGTKEFPDVQALQFPRLGIEGVTGVPVNLKKATAEYAMRASSAALAPDPVVDPTGRGVTYKREKLGPLEEETHFAETGPGSSLLLFKPYPAADGLLAGLLKSSQGRTIRN